MEIIKWLKKYGWIILAIILLVIAGIYAWRRFISNINFDFNLRNLTNMLGEIQGRYANPSAQRGMGLYLTVPVDTIIKNSNQGSFNMKDAKIDLSYMGDTILRTAPDSEGVTAKVGGKDDKPVPTNMEVLINENTIKFVTALIRGQKPQVDYLIKTKLFGLPYSFSNSKVIQEKQPV